MTEAARILLVEDDPDDRTVVAEHLHSGAFPVVVVEAPDGVAFAAHLARGDFDAVITEQRLGWGEGLRLLCTVKDFYPDRPVIFLTQETDPDLESRAVALGAEGFLPKTSRGYARLLALLGEHLDRSAHPRSRRVETETDAPAAHSTPPGSSERAAHLTRAVTHDLQEPLQLVIRYTRLLDERFRDRLDADGARCLEHLTASADRMQEMIDDLLTYSRVGSEACTVERVALDEVIDAALETLQGILEETGARVTRSALPTVRADRSQMVRLFQNLLGNAIKFRGAEPPEVHVGAHRRDGGWDLTVRDNGIGIPPADQERIFQPFQRLHAVEEYPGTGVGLALCRRIAEIHGGELTVDSAPGAGATFTLTLPPEATA